MENPQLYIVPTPIGNLEDITYRAVRILGSSDLILAEDTRMAARLLQRYDIKTPVKSYHKFNESRSTEYIIERLSNNQIISLISDAGTPGISDPGYLIIKECIKKNIPITCLPGPTALIPALVLSGFPIESFSFFGFIPKKKGRSTFLGTLAEKKETLVFYESPHRLLRTLNDFAAVFGAARLVSVSRELSKIYEETYRGTLENAILFFSETKIRGEFVLVVHGY